MNKEEAERILDPATTREALAAYAYDPEQRIRVVEEACRIAERELRGETDHSRDGTKMIPLTLEQLRDMDGQPVWVERNEKPHDGKWFIVSHADIKNPDKTLYTKEGVTYSNYGVYFTAYAYPQAHIDREAWEKCGVCDCEAITFEATDKGKYPYKGFCIGGGAKFCPWCGRPRSDKAWEALEKRLRE